MAMHGGKVTSVTNPTLGVLATLGTAEVLAGHVQLPVF